LLACNHFQIWGGGGDDSILWLSFAQQQVKTGMPILKTLHPGTDAVILKIFSPKKMEKKFAFFTLKTAM
jgi:hypothetical protein